MQVLLRKCDFDIRFTEGSIDVCVQSVDHGQAIIQVRQVRSDDEVQRVVTEGFESRVRTGITHRQRMVVADLQQQFFGLGDV